MESRVDERYNNMMIDSFDRWPSPRCNFDENHNKVLYYEGGEANVCDAADEFVKIKLKEKTLSDGRIESSNAKGESSVVILGSNEKWLSRIKKKKRIQIKMIRGNYAWLPVELMRSVTMARRKTNDDDEFLWVFFPCFALSAFISVLNSHYSCLPRICR